MTSCIFHFDASVFCRMLKPLASLGAPSVFYASANLYPPDCTRIFWAAACLLCECILASPGLHSHVFDLSPYFIQVYSAECLNPHASLGAPPAFYASAYQHLLDYTRMFWTFALILYKCILQNLKIHAHLLGCRLPFMRVHTSNSWITLACFGPPPLFDASVFCRILKSTRIFRTDARPLCE